MTKIIKFIKNGEMLFLYDASYANPNGSKDDENAPRMDIKLNRNLVSPARMKKYIREFGLMKALDIFVSLVDGEAVTSGERLKDITIKEATKKFIDLRLFGGINTKEGEKGITSLTGPVQFNWGYSLNEVDVVEFPITSTFKSDESKKKGAIGKDFRVKYSLIAFSGTVSGYRAKETGLKEDDLDFLDEAMVKAIPLLPTYTKGGQYPRLYMRLEFKNSETMLKDLRTYLKLEETKNLSGIKDVVLEVDELVEYLKEKKDLIDAINLFVDEDLKITYKGETATLESLLSDFNIKKLQ